MRKKQWNEKKGKKPKRAKKGIQRLILMLCLIPTMLVGLCIGIFGVMSIKNGMETEALRALELLSNSARSAFNNIGEGDYYLEGEQLYKGNVNLLEQQMEKLLVWFSPDNQQKKWIVT